MKPYPDEIKNLRLDARVAMDEYAAAVRNHQIAVSALQKWTGELQAAIDKLCDAAAKGVSDAR